MLVLRLKRLPCLRQRDEVAGKNRDHQRITWNQVPHVELEEKIVLKKGHLVGVLIKFQDSEMALIINLLIKLLRLP